MNVEDLKCCGNCRFRVSTNMGEYSEEMCALKENSESFQYCDKWDYDGLHREIRKLDYRV